MAAWFERFDILQAERLRDLTVKCDEPMCEHTTFRIGGNARRFACPKSTEELHTLLDLAEEAEIPFLVIGNGSNLLVSDSGIDKLVIYTGSIDQMQLLEGDRILAAAGVSLARLAVFAKNHALTGLEFAHGIPGSLGGAVCMNAGAYGGDMSQVITEVTAWLPDRGVCTLTAQEADLSYRHSYFSNHRGVVLSAVMQLKTGSEEEIRAQMEELIRRRREKQPLEFPSAGSTFKRPEGHFAGALIEQCGLKGVGVGGAEVSEKHAGFVINKGGATCSDVLRLIEKIRADVLEKTGVSLEPEIKMVD